MAIIYRTSGPWGAGKGANLVAGEVDGNFYDLDGRVATVEGKLPTVVSIAWFDVSGNLFYVHMSDGTIQGPFRLPATTWVFRGAWTPSTVYSANDLVTANGSTYMVLLNHVSAASFDPGANDGAGHDFYGLMLSNPANVLPPGGLTGQYLTKTTDADFAIGWHTPTIVPSQIVLEAPNPTYTLTLNNIASYVRCTNASGCSIVIPEDVSLNFPTGVEISFRQCTSAGVVLTPASTNVLLNPITGLASKTNRLGAVITAKKIAANSWDVFGLLSS